MMASEGDVPSIETTFEAWLRALKQGAPWEDALMALQRCVQVMQSRKNWIRANIVLAKTAKEKEQAAWCAQQAGDTLWALMNRPNLALACYRFAADLSGATRIRHHSSCRHLLWRHVWWGSEFYFAGYSGGIDCRGHHF